MKTNLPFLIKINFVIIYFSYFCFLILFFLCVCVWHTLKTIKQRKENKTAFSGDFLSPCGSVKQCRTFGYGT